MDIHKTLAALYTETAQYKSANDHQRIYAEMKDSLLNKEKMTAINELDFKYRTAEKDKQLIAKQLIIKENENKLNQKNLWIGGISLSVLFFATLMINYYRINKHKQRLQKEQYLSLQREQQINQLKAMLSGEEKERGRMARELHDGIMGQLSVVKLNLNAAKKRSMVVIR